MMLVQEAWLRELLCYPTNDAFVVSPACEVSLRSCSELEDSGKHFHVL